MKIFETYCKSSQILAKNRKKSQFIAIFWEKTQRLTVTLVLIIANHCNLIQFYWNKFNYAALSQMNFWQIACLVRRHRKYFQIWRLFEICLFQIVSINLKLFQIISKFLKKSQIIANNCSKSRKIVNYRKLLQCFSIFCKNLRFIAIYCDYLQLFAKNRNFRGFQCQSQSQGYFCPMDYLILFPQMSCVALRSDVRTLHSGISLYRSPMP